jgi:hypothetical protein
VRRGRRKGVPNAPGEHDAVVRRDLLGELRLAAVVAGLAVREAAAKSIAGVFELVGVVTHVGQGDGGDDKEGFQSRRGAAVGSGSGWGDGLPELAGVNHDELVELIVFDVVIGVADEEDEGGSESWLSVVVVAATALVIAIRGATGSAISQPPLSPPSGLDCLCKHGLQQDVPRGVEPVRS